MSIWKNGKLVAGGRQVTPLLSFMWADHILDDISWLRADTFSWHTGNETTGMYPAVYQHLADDIDGKTLQSETIGNTTIQFYLADDGHKICPASEESNVVAIYNATGVAWYYIIDTTNERFKLPRSKHSKYSATNPVVGTGMTLGLTNGTSTGSLTSSNSANVNPVIANNGYGASVGTITGHDAWTDLRAIGVTTDATKSGIVAQQTEDTDQYKYLYFYVGNYTQTAIENTAGLNAELFNDKANVDLDNVSATGKTTSVGWNMPDYSTGTTATQGTEYTATENCYLYARVFCSGTGSNQHIEKQIIINGVVVAQPRAFYYCADCVMMPCAKGSTYKFENVNTGSGSYDFKVYRCIGG